jgi:hypothetical protein
MKNVKIMLTAIAVLAVVGGALAFKAKKFQSICYYSSDISHTTDPGDRCPFVGAGTITGVGNISTYATTTVLNAAFADCTQQDLLATPSLPCTTTVPTAGQD